MKNLIRMIVGLSALVLLTVGIAGTAGAIGYAGATVSTGQNVQAGSTNVATGTGFTPDSTVTVSLGAEVLGSVLVAADGSFSLSYKVPSACGSYTLSATNGAQTQTTTLVVACAAAPAASTGSLPYTGNNSSMPLAQIGTGLLAAGAIVVFGVRRRNQHLAHAKVDA